MVFSPTSDTPFAAMVVACCTSAAVSSRPFGGNANPTPRGATLIPTGAGVVKFDDFARWVMRSQMESLASSLMLRNAHSPAPPQKRPSSSVISLVGLLHLLLR